MHSLHIFTHAECMWYIYHICTCAYSSVSFHPLYTSSAWGHQDSSHSVTTVDTAVVDIGVQVSWVSLHLYLRSQLLSLHLLVAGRLYLYLPEEPPHCFQGGCTSPRSHPQWKRVEWVLQDLLKVWSTFHFAVCGLQLLVLKYFWGSRVLGSVSVRHFRC